MEENKRVAGEFEITDSLSVGDEEIVMGKNSDSSKYMCGMCVSNELFVQYKDILVSDDFVEILEVYGQRIAEKSQILLSYRDTNIPYEMFKNDSYSPLNQDQRLVNKVVVIDPNSLKREYRNSTNQLYLITGGFGAEANARGRALFAKNIYTGKQDTWCRKDILGILKPECTPKWAKDKITALKDSKTR